MKALPPQFDEQLVADNLAKHYDFQAQSLEYRPWGMGSYHWIATDQSRSLFVTLDMLDRGGPAKSTAAFRDLRASYDTAWALRHKHGLDFVHPPILSTANQTTVQVSQRFSISAAEVLDGNSGSSEHQFSPETAAKMADALTRIQDATPLVRSVARVDNLDFTGRANLHWMMAQPAELWDRGPFSQGAHQLLVDNVSGILDGINAYDQLAAEVAKTRDRWVVTHGDPHPGNLMQVADTHKMIDWDMAMIAPPERDLRWLDPEHPDLNADAVRFYAQRYVLDDLSIFAARLFNPHERNGDTEHTWERIHLRVESALEMGSEWRSQNRALDSQQLQLAPQIEALGAAFDM